MAGMNGIALAKKLKDLIPKINIIFVTAYSEYATEAFELYPSGYVLKPVTKEAAEREIENLRHPLEQKGGANLYVQTFGNFEVFSNGAPLKFRYSKSKELLAYLIDRNGAAVNTNQLCAVLWEEKQESKNMKTYLRKLVSDLMKTLREAGADDIIQKRYNNFAVVPDKIDCDSYGFMKGDPKCINAYKGQYMFQYSWAEMTDWNQRGK
jgi:two-component SAPR family response regulator